MKKLTLALIMLLLSLFSGTAYAEGNSLIITQRNSADTGNILRTILNPPTDGILIWNQTTKLPSYLTVGAGLVSSGGVLSAVPQTFAQVNADWSATSGAAAILNKPTLFSGAWADLTGKPTLSPVALTGSYNDLADKPVLPAPYVFDFGLPAARTVALSTAYQAITPAKAAIVTVSPQCTATLTLSGGGTCTLQARVGAAGLTCSTGTVVATWTNANTGALSVGLALNQTIGSPYGINLPAGAAFILCPTAGTFTVSAVDQTAG
jgi:hypothetical protein